MKERSAPLFPWKMFASELIGTALLVLVGLSLVILMFGTGSPIIGAVPSDGVRRLITGFLFGSAGALIALSPVGRESGAHINPVVTLGFWLMGKMESRVAIGYVLAQLIGAWLGALPLLAWGSMGRSVAYGATLPGAGYSTGIVVLGEVVTTFALIAGLCVFLGFRSLRPFTPAMFPFLFALMVWAESPISGTSTNPARSLGPAIVSGEWQGWWIYWVGPLIGTLVAIVAFSFLAKRISVAKVYFFDSDPHRMFHKAPGAS
ncbi:MAG: aquaporin [Deltaproteobacteria bacterium]|nr:aquaporin [Deltaproteobacteria bacterium]